MNELKLTGTLIKKCEAEKGTSKSGKEFQNRTFIIEVSGTYPKQIAFTLFNDKVSLINGIKEGTEIDVHFNLESRDFNGKWYHNINAWKIDSDANQSQQSSNNSSSGSLPPSEHATQGMNEQPDDAGNDLPF